MPQARHATLSDTDDLTLLRRHAEEAAGLLRALANEQRLLLLCQMVHGEQNVSALSARSGLSQSAVSQHLSILRSSGLVSTRRQAQSVFYSIAEGPVQTLMATLHEIYCAPKSEEG